MAASRLGLVQVTQENENNAARVYYKCTVNDTRHAVGAGSYKPLTVRGTNKRISLGKRLV